MIKVATRFNESSRAFTVVELVIVVIVIGILALLATIAYTSITTQTRETSLKSDLQSGAAQLKTTRLAAGTYPATSSNISKTSTTTFNYTRTSSSTYCLEATDSSTPSKVFKITETGTVEEGTCPSVGIPLQTVTTSNCPTTRTRAVDVRDNHTYWIQKLADGKCWMLTNLGYAGGGTNTYSDVKTLTNGTGSAGSSTTARYYVPPSTVNFTTEPADPSTSTDGGVTGSQYGYYYNWCGAMGNQQGTAACQNGSTPVPNVGLSICPAGWRLPTGNGGEVAALNTAVNGGSTSTDAGLRSAWLGQWTGYWSTSSSAFVAAGSGGYYWTSTVQTLGAYQLSLSSSNVVITGNTGKANGQSVRCVAV